MKILFIAPLPPPMTGQALACQVILKELQTRHDVDVVDLSKDTFKQGLSSFHRVKEIFNRIWKVWKSKARTDVIYFTISESFLGNVKDLLIYSVCFGKLSKMIVHLHGGAGMRRLLAEDRFILRSINKFFLKRLGAIVILGQRHADMFEALNLEKKLHIVPNFAEDGVFSSLVKIHNKFKDTEVIRVLFLSNLLPGKGHIELVKAYENLDPSVQARMRIDFAGGFESDFQKSEFLALISDHGKLVYHGTVGGQEKVDLLSAAHVFCLPTYYPYEGQPISILEAYAAGCAVITTDHSGIYDIFTDGVNGLGVSKKSALSLSEALITAALNQVDLERIGTHNWKVANERYTVEQYNSNLLAVFDSLNLT